MNRSADPIAKRFAPGEAATYFSSEKPGLIVGGEALLAHHRAFGFVPGGRTFCQRSPAEMIRSSGRYEGFFF